MGLSSALAAVFAVAFAAVFLATFFVVFAAGFSVVSAFASVAAGLRVRGAGLGFATAAPSLPPSADAAASLTLRGALGARAGLSATGELTGVAGAALTGGAAARLTVASPPSLPEGFRTGVVFSTAGALDSAGITGAVVTALFSPEAL